MSVPGIVAGSLLVFIPVVGEFIIPEMLGGSDRLYYGKILWEEFFVNRNWPGASALAFSGIIILVLPIVIFQILYSRWSQKMKSSLIKSTVIFLGLFFLYFPILV